MSGGLFLGAFGDPGHTFPMLALGCELAERGHAVTLQTWRRWQPDVEAAGIDFVPAPEYPVFPTPERPLSAMYAVVAQATGETRAQIAAIRPHAVVADILTLAPALAAELERIPYATLIPHLYPVVPPGGPPFALGARPPATPLGRWLWRRTERLAAGGLGRGRDELNAVRTTLGLQPQAHFHGGLSRQLCLVATLPQLEYPRQWPRQTQLVGPLLWEPKTGVTAVPLPPTAEPTVLIAPSTAQDRELKLLRAALQALADLPLRVIATANRPLLPQEQAIAVPDNAQLVPWLSYAQTMPSCQLVVCHGGHGTVMRALASGCPLVVCPAGGDMPENAARVAWAGLGVRVPSRLVGPRTVRLAVRYLLERPAFAARATALAAQLQPLQTGRARAATLVERLARSGTSDLTHSACGRKR